MYFQLGLSLTEIMLDIKANFKAFAPFTLKNYIDIVDVVLFVLKELEKLG